MSEISELSNYSGEVHKTPWRLKKSLEINRGLVTPPPEVKGWEYFYSLPDTLHPVIATTHMTDTDVQVGASVFANVVDVAVASMQTNQADKLIGKLVSLAGRGNFFDVANTFEEGKPSFCLDAKNFLEMARAVNERDKTMVIASHSPVYDKRELPNTPGIAAAIVANLSDRVILPVAVYYDTDERVGMSDDIPGSAKRLLTGKRPSSQVCIAEPIFLDELPEEYRTSQDDILESLGMFSSDRRKAMTKPEQIKAIET